MFEKLVAVFIVGGTKLLTGATARWKGCEPDSRQRIFVANHTSHLDFILLVKRTRRPLMWVLS